MADKPIQIAHLQAAWLKDLFNKCRRRPILTQHIGRELAGYLAADMNPKLLFLLNQQQPCINSLLQIEPCLFGFILVPEPVSAAHEEVLHINFLSGVVKIVFADAFAVDGAEVSRAAARPGSAIVRIEKDHERNNGDRGDNGPKPGLMFSNCTEHKILSTKGTENVTGFNTRVKRESLTNC